MAVCFSSLNWSHVYFSRFFFKLIFIKISKSICFHVYHIKSFYSFTPLLLPEMRTLTPCPVSSTGTVSGDGRPSTGILASSCWFLCSCSVLCGPWRNRGDLFPVWRVNVLVSEGYKEEPQRFRSCSENVLNTPCLTSLKQRPSDSEHQPCFSQAASFSGWFRPLPSAGPAWWFAVAGTG